MSYTNARVKNTALFEEMLYITRCIGGRISNLYTLFRKRKSYISAKSYFPEALLKSKSQIFFDQLTYILRHGEINKYYFAMGFDRKDKKDCARYLPIKRMDHARDKKNYILPDYDNYNFVCLLNDKFTFGSFCRGLGFPTPVNIGIVEGGKLLLIQSKKQIPFGQITTLTIDAYCKILAGLQGKGTFHLEVKNGMIYKSGNLITIEELAGAFGNHKWIVQERIADQHKSLSLLHPESINTIRLTTVNTGAVIEIISAALKVGVNGAKVDNWSAGGVLIGIDLTTGTLEKWGFFKPGKGTKTDKHPNSNIIFEGIRFPIFTKRAIKPYFCTASCTASILSVGILQ